MKKNAETERKKNIAWIIAASNAFCDCQKRYERPLTHSHTHQNARYLNNNLFGFSFHLFSGPFLRFVAVEPAACIRMLPYKLLMPTRRRKMNGISTFARARERLCSWNWQNRTNRFLIENWIVSILVSDLPLLASKVSSQLLVLIVGCLLSNWPLYSIRNWHEQTQPQHQRINVRTYKSFFFWIYIL